VTTPPAKERQSHIPTLEVRVHYPTKITLIDEPAYLACASGLALRLTTANCSCLQMLHAFMPAVDVELSVQYGGATEAGSDW
jgi:hypothetical protein